MYPLWYTDIMAKIPLGGKLGIGEFATVDEEDVERVAGIRWYLTDSGYAANRYKDKTTRMHRLINNTPEDMVTDHKNGDRLDNRKSNLRTVTQKENTNNRKNTKGYCWVSSKSLWKVSYRGRHYSYARSEEEARRIYVIAKSGVPKSIQTHPRRKFLPRGVYYMQPMAQRECSPYFIRPQIKGIKYFQGYFKTVAEAQVAYNKFQQERG